MRILAALGAFLILAAPAFADELRAFVDPRVELVGVVQYLAGLHRDAGRPVSADFPDLEARFAPFRAHPAVKLFAASAARGEDASALAMQYLTPLPELKWAKDPALARDVVDRAGGRAEFERFLTALRDFSAKSRFPEYFKEHRRAFLRYEGEARAELDRRDLAKLVRDYAGPGPDFTLVYVLPVIYTPGLTCYIIPYPYAGPKRNGGRRVAGPFDVITIARRYEVDASRPYYGLDDAAWRGALNEALHLSVDSAFYDYEDELAARKSVFQGLEGGDCAGGWTQCSTAILVSALATRLDPRHRPDENGGKRAKLEAALVARLAEYENDRKRYPTLADFFPRWIDALKP